MRIPEAFTTAVRQWLRLMTPSASRCPPLPKKERSPPIPYQIRPIHTRASAQELASPKENEPSPPSHPRPIHVGSSAHRRPRARGGGLAALRLDHPSPRGQVPLPQVAGGAQDRGGPRGGDARAPHRRGAQVRRTPSHRACSYRLGTSHPPPTLISGARSEIWSEWPRLNGAVGAWQRQRRSDWWRERLRARRK